MTSPRVLSRAVLILCLAGMTASLLPGASAIADDAATVPLDDGHVEQQTIDAPATDQVTAAGSHVSEPTAVPAFTLVGFTLPEGATLAFRTSSDGVEWQGWVEAPTFAQEGEAIARADGGPTWANHTEPFWVGEAGYLQTRLTGGDPSEVEVHLIDTGAEGTEHADAGSWLARTAAAARTLLSPAVAHASSSQPAMVSRAQWGAGPSRTPSMHSGVRAATLHHTAGSNNYTCAQAPGVVRGIWSYHTKTLGWSDVGYHFMVDKCGVVYEGRAGGVGKPVLGAHAGGFNSGTFGISILGDYSRIAPTQAAIDAVADVVGWKFALHGIDPRGEVTLTSAGSTRYASGRKVTLPTLFGHRAVSATACPGDVLNGMLPTLRTKVAARTAAHAGASPTAPAPAPTAAPAPASGAANLKSLGGTDPIATALAVSKEAFTAGSASHAVVTHTQTFADAMTAGPLAGRDGPLLYTGSTLPSSVLAELERVLPAGKRVYLVGGEAVVPRAVAEALGRRWDVRRLAGPTRLETSSAVAAEVVAVRGRRVALVARAYGGPAPWADAVAGGAYGARHGTPVLLTASDQLSQPTHAAIDGLKIERTVVLGGTGAVSDAVLRRLPDSRRIAGADRTGTAVAVAIEMWGRVTAAPTDRYVLAGGYGEADWPAALAAAPLVARRDAPLLLTAPDQLSPATAAYLGGLGYTSSRAATGWVIGGGVGQAARAQTASTLGR